MHPPCLPVPIYYNYRHAIELALKSCIRTAANCLRRGVRLPDDQPDKLLNTSHAVHGLADRLNQYLGQLHLDPPNDRIDDITQATLDWLHQLDNKGQAFRYSRVKGSKGGDGLVRARPHQQNIDFDADIRRLHTAARKLYGGTADTCTRTRTSKPSTTQRCVPQPGDRAAGPRPPRLA
ncbi:hypothetical protein [Streptomyces sp. NPDC001165]|uniref:hypothetical protein n=1 Tax=Streptomyces sp. NPDC001165 TaxID=3364546 RepID=UPI003695D985